MSPAERRNEHLKLVANWSNTIATSIVTAGTFVPAAQLIYGFLPKDADLVLVYGTPFALEPGCSYIYSVSGS